jgi:hypothetical protein
VWNNNVVAAWGATNASTVTYLAPVVGVLLGTFVLHERLGWSEPIGAAVVILGLTLSQDRLNPRLWRLRRASRFRSGGPHHLNREPPGYTMAKPDRLGRSRARLTRGSQPTYVTGKQA